MKKADDEAIAEKIEREFEAVRKKIMATLILTMICDVFINDGNTL